MKIRLLELAPEAGGSKDTGILNSLHILAEDCMYVDVCRSTQKSTDISSCISKAANLFDGGGGGGGEDDAGSGA